MAGTFLNYEFSPSNLLYGGLYYYTQALKDRKVDIGQEPMTNWMWNVGGSFSREIPEINSYINNNSYLDFDMSLNDDFEYAEIYPNPNPLGRAILMISKVLNYLHISLLSIHPIKNHLLLVMA